MDRLKDALILSQKSLKETIRKIKISYVLLIEIFILLMISNYRLINSGNFFVGLIEYLIQIALMSFIVSSLNDIVNYNRSGKENPGYGFKRYFSPLINTYFIIYVVKYILYSIVILANLPINLYLLLLFAFNVIISPVFEFIYINNYYGYDIILRSIEFIKSNFIAWIIPASLYAILELNAFSLFPRFFLLPSIVTLAIKSILLTLLYMYKGHLYKKLNNSSYRKRKFMENFR